MTKPKIIEQMKLNRLEIGILDLFRAIRSISEIRN